MSLSAFYDLPEWEQDLHVARHEADKCPQCDNPREVCGNPETSWYPVRSICYFTMANEAFNRMWSDLHDKRPFHDGMHKSWAEKASSTHPYHRDDGMRVWASPVDLNPDDDFLADGGDPFGD